MRTPTSRPLARAACIAAAAAMLGAGAVSGPAVAADDDAAAKAPTTIVRGKVVRAANANPVPGVLVTIRDVGDEIGDLDVIGSGQTNARGVYRIEVPAQDEYNIKINGRAKGFETGFLACTGPSGTAAVVPTWGEACSHGDGLQPTARLQKL